MSASRHRVRHLFYRLEAMKPSNVSEAQRLGGRSTLPQPKPRSDHRIRQLERIAGAEGVLEIEILKNVVGE